MIIIILILSSIMIGIVTNMFGIGGGFIIVPLLCQLLYKQPLNVYIAINTSMVIVTINALISSIKNYKLHNIYHNNYSQEPQNAINSAVYNISKSLLPYIITGSVVALFIVQYIKNQHLHYIFIGYLLYAIYLNINHSKLIGTAHIASLYLSKLQNICIGLIIGFIAIFLGVGGGLLIVPILQKYKINNKIAIMISNILSIAIGGIGSIGYGFIAYNMQQNLGHMYLGFIFMPAIIIFFIGGIVGVKLSNKLSKYVSDKLHNKIYLILLIVILTITIYAQLK